MAVMSTKIRIRLETSVNAVKSSKITGGSNKYHIKGETDVSPSG